LVPGIKPGQERGPDGKLLPKANASLSTDSADTLAAMRFVVSNPPTADTTHQQKSMRQWKDSSPTTFFGRLADLEKAELSKPPAPPEPAAYDGEGLCPTCHRPPGEVQIDPFDGLTDSQMDERVLEQLRRFRDWVRLQKESTTST
jgi:hypothetical protein